MRLPETKTSSACTTLSRGERAFGHQTKILRPVLLQKRKSAPDILAEVFFLRSTNSLCCDVMFTKQMFD